MSPGRSKTSPKLTPLLTLTWAPVIRPEVAEAEKALELRGARARLGWDRVPNAQECSQICAWLQGPPPGSPLIPLKASQTGLRRGLPCGGPWRWAGLLSGPPCWCWALEALGKGKAVPEASEPSSQPQVLSSPEPMPRIAAAQGRARFGLVHVSPTPPPPPPHPPTPRQASPSPFNLFCLLCAACPVAPSALTPDPDCNSSSLLTTLFTQWLSQAPSRGLVPCPSAWHSQGKLQPAWDSQMPGASRKTRECVSATDVTAAEGLGGSSYPSSGMGLDQYHCLKVQSARAIKTFQ